MKSSSTFSKGSKGLKTLAIDIGGTGIKAIVLDEQGSPMTERARVSTPRPATPEAVLAAITDLAKNQGSFDRGSVGFPGVIRHGLVSTAPNLDSSWRGFNLGRALSKRLNTPIRAANDADVQGFGAIQGCDIELVLTLGTGFGSALFVDGKLVPNLEIAHHPFRRGKSYEEELGDKALKKIGKKKWNKRLSKAIETLDHLFNFDYLYIGGGNSKKVTLALPSHIQIIPNVAGLLGGIAFWKFGADDPMQRWVQDTRIKPSSTNRTKSRPSKLRSAK